MFCPSCGAALNESAKFCENCGARLGADDGFFGAAPEPFHLAPGYSRLLESEAVRLALKKQKRAAGIAGVVICLLPLLGFVIYGAVSDSMEIGRAITTGLIVSAVFTLTALISVLKTRLTRPFEGTVEDKKHIHRYTSSARRSGRSRNEYFLYLRTEDGRRRKKGTNAAIFNYLEIGDRVRFLPQFAQPFEKYDKSRDREIPCMFCSRMNPIEAESCSFCRNPMLK